MNSDALTPAALCVIFLRVKFEARFISTAWSIIDMTAVHSINQEELDNIFKLIGIVPVEQPTIDTSVTLLTSAAIVDNASPVPSSSQRPARLQSPFPSHTRCNRTIKRSAHHPAPYPPRSQGKRLGATANTIRRDVLLNGRGMGSRQVQGRGKINNKGNGKGKARAVNNDNDEQMAPPEPELHSRPEIEQGIMPSSALVPLILTPFLTTVSTLPSPLSPAPISPIFLTPATPPVVPTPLAQWTTYDNRHLHAPCTRSRPQGQLKPEQSKEPNRRSERLRAKANGRAGPSRAEQAVAKIVVDDEADIEVDVNAEVDVAADVDVDVEHDGPVAVDEPTIVMATTPANVVVPTPEPAIAPPPRSTLAISPAQHVIASSPLPTTFTTSCVPFTSFAPTQPSYASTSRASISSFAPRGREFAFTSLRTPQAHIDSDIEDDDPYFPLTADIDWEIDLDEVESVTMAPVAQGEKNNEEVEGNEEDDNEEAEEEQFLLEGRGQDPSGIETPYQQEDEEHTTPDLVIVSRSSTSAGYGAEHSGERDRVDFYPSRAELYEEGPYVTLATSAYVGVDDDEDEMYGGEASYAGDDEGIDADADAHDSGDDTPSNEPLANELLRERHHSIAAASQASAATESFASREQMFEWQRHSPPALPSSRLSSLFRPLTLPTLSPRPSPPNASVLHNPPAHGIDADDPADYVVSSPPLAPRLAPACLPTPHYAHTSTFYEDEHIARRDFIIVSSPSPVIPFVTGLDVGNSYVIDVSDNEDEDDNLAEESKVIRDTDKDAAEAKIVSVKLIGPRSNSSEVESMVTFDLSESSEFNTSELNALDLTFDHDIDHFLDGLHDREEVVEGGSGLLTGPTAMYPSSSASGVDSGYGSLSRPPSPPPIPTIIPHPRPSCWLELRQHYQTGHTPHTGTLTHS